MPALLFAYEFSGLEPALEGKGEEAVAILDVAVGCASQLEGEGEGGGAVEGAAGAERERAGVGGEVVGDEGALAVEGFGEGDYLALLHEIGAGRGGVDEDVAVAEAEGELEVPGGGRLPAEAGGGLAAGAVEGEVAGIGAGEFVAELRGEGGGEALAKDEAGGARVGGAAGFAG